jgi:hypothetical protein
MFPVRVGRASLERRPAWRKTTAPRFVDQCVDQFDDAESGCNRYDAPEMGRNRYGAP